MRTSPILVGTCGQSSPALADYQSFQSLISPRALDIMLTLGNLSAEPIFYSAYPTWAATLGASMLCTSSPGSMTLGAFSAGTYDTTGLYSNTGLHGLTQACASYGQPMIIRLAHEFNGGSAFGYSYGYGNETAAQFVAGWQHIVSYFRTQGATNVQWMWCPNEWLIPSGSPCCDPTAADGSGVNWYPGDAYVDWIALDGYASTSASSASTPAQVFLSSYTAICALTSTKPFAIAEVGCAEDPRLSTLCGGKAGWYELFFQMIANQMPRCGLVCNWSQVIVPPATNDGDYTINSSGSNPAALTAFQSGIDTWPFAQHKSGAAPLLIHAGGA